MCRVLLLLVLYILALVTAQQAEETSSAEQTAMTDENGGDLRGHIAVIRPDYTLWKMVKVLRNMFESRTEKRRQRDLKEPSPMRQLQELRARRLFFNF